MELQSNRWMIGVILAAGSALLSGCAQSHLRIESDFGQAVSQDLAAQIADPDAGRNAGPPPPSDGARANLALQRYRQNQVIQPSTVGASGSSPGYGGIGAGAGTGGPVAGGAGPSGP